ncbi:MAG TPA: type II toxin-antitoxin system YafQ family toxin [Sulfurospirillum arcachonense]|nr:type II toxin-antitoxin system YafQ family toxin [Sulfurospirillum arcachonense]
MKYSVFRATSFKKAFKKLTSQNQNAILVVIEKLVNGQTLEAKYKDHLLVGNFKGCRECHVKPDLLLIYRIKDEIMELALIETGNHYALFG